MQTNNAHEYTDEQIQAALDEALSASGLSFRDCAGDALVSGEVTHFARAFLAAHEWFAQVVEARLRGKVSNQEELEASSDPTLLQQLAALFRDFVAQLRDIAGLVKDKAMAEQIRAEADAVQAAAEAMAAKAGLQVKAEEAGQQFQQSPDFSGLVAGADTTPSQEPLKVTTPTVEKHLRSFDYLTSNKRDFDIQALGLSREDVADAAVFIPDHFNAGSAASYGWMYGWKEGRKGQRNPGDRNMGGGIQNSIIQGNQAYDQKFGIIQKSTEPDYIDKGMGPKRLTKSVTQAVSSQPAAQAQPEPSPAQAVPTAGEADDTPVIADAWKRHIGTKVEPIKLRPGVFKIGRLVYGLYNAGKISEKLAINGIPVGDNQVLLRMEEEEAQTTPAEAPALPPTQAAAVAKEEAMPEPVKQAAPFDAAAAKGEGQAVVVNEPPQDNGQPGLSGESEKQAQPWTPAVGDTVRLKSGGDVYTVMRYMVEKGEWPCVASPNCGVSYLCVPAACLTQAKEGQP